MNDNYFRCIYVNIIVIFSNKPAHDIFNMKKSISLALALFLLSISTVPTNALPVIGIAGKCDRTTNFGYAIRSYFEEMILNVTSDTVSHTSWTSAENRLLSKNSDEEGFLMVQLDYITMNSGLTGLLLGSTAGDCGEEGSWGGSPSYAFEFGITR